MAFCSMRLGCKLLNVRCHLISQCLSLHNMDVKDHESTVNRDYDEVIKALNNLQSNSSVLQNIKPSKECQGSNLPLTNKYLLRCGIDLSELSGKVIHVSGTKGKGSTCALTESILRHHHYKTGFYSSPHLFSVTERIRINGKPLSKDLFIKYFWDVYNILDNNKENSQDMPTYFKFLTVMAFKVFICEKVDVAVVEVGIGGEYDCTNVLRDTSVVGITSLGYDHLKVLGNTIEEIAWNKSGIMKPNCVAFTCRDQPCSALQVIQQRSQEKKCSLYVIDRNLDLNGCKTHKLIELNSSLAVHLAQAWISLNKGSSSLSFDKPVLDEKTIEGLRSFVWPGRFHVVSRGNVIYYLDGAHTDDSMNLCVDWFNSSVPSKCKKGLVFNITKQRDPEVLLKILSRCHFNEVTFCPNLLDSTPLTDNVSLSTQSQTLNKCVEHAGLWKKLTNQDSRVYKSVSETFDWFRVSTADSIHVLVTGSLHLVGNATFYLQPDVWNLPLSKS